MNIKIPEFSLVVLIGVSGSGKSTLAKRLFKRTEIVSSDECRALVSNSEIDQSASKDAFDLLHFLVGKRLKNGLLTVIDATNTQKEARKSLVQLARQHHCLPVAIVLDLPERVCQDRTDQREDRNFGNHVIRNQHTQLKRSLRYLKEDGFKQIYTLRSEEEVNAVENIVREKLYSNKKDLTGPFDIIGDIHGCFDELHQLLTEMDYKIECVTPDDHSFGFNVVPPTGHSAIFLGDLVDRGPNSPDVLRLVMSMVNNGTALCVPGNHDLKLQRYLTGRNVTIKHGLAETLAQLANESSEFKKKVELFIYQLTSHYVLDGGNLVVSHAGLREEMHGRSSGAVREFCVYGETTGEIDEFGLPVRYNWAKEYRGKAKVIFGHTPVPTAEWLNNTMDIDTGCVFGGKLTALRYPSLALVSVPAREVYCVPTRPINFEERNAATSDDDMLELEDVTGKRIIETRLKPGITIREENSIAALEVMSRFAVNPKWLIYLPPTMSPCETSPLDGYLEHPNEALRYYQSRGIRQVVCEEKHMGSRAILVICKDEATALRRFGVVNEGIGVCYTRTGRNFFNNPDIETAFLNRVAAALTNTNFWEKLNTDWVCLDAELMPWSAKAQSLIREQYAAVGAAAGGALPDVNLALQQAVARGIGDATPFLEKFGQKQNAIDRYVKAYRHYCWDVNSIDDYKLAPFHILATEGNVHADKNHVWHMETIAEFCEGDPQILMKTPYKIVNFDDETTVEAAVEWWTQLTQSGGEGMVVKPMSFIGTNQDGLVQPAVKCRGSEYLRIIYGPEYDAPYNIERLRKRNLSKKQSLAFREFALSVESLERFVAKEPLRRTHEAVFGVLALESEDVDPRL